jgi:kynurenine formamidase
MKIIDLTHTISEFMTVYPGSEKPVLRNIATVKTNGYNEQSLTFFSHTGTHIDAPAHIISNGKTLDRYDLTTFFGKAIVIDCTACSLIDEVIIENSLSGKDPPKFLLFYTGWDRHWCNDNYFHNYPVLSPEAATYITQLSLNGLGIDAASYDPFDSKDLINHHILLEHELILIENLCHLNQIRSREVLFSCFPLKIKQTDGSPTRAVAITSTID